MSFVFNGGVAIGLVSLAMGVICLRYTRELLRLHNTLLTLGHRTPPTSHEPADWSVSLTRLASALLIAMGVGMIGAQQVS